ncbi:hypothetical protein K1T71_008196 [Dendrolimus kikuchii]|uniref:Uncharacterized protein n=1 Tax=Dendrolimus kikuchii TaxID=765133 RepID=A0ACC1CXM0_9NEOP|nr:hypothetical protein K1T71_008196 [Dendrolimus kikuchii]
MGSAVNNITNDTLGLNEYTSDAALAAVELFKDYPEELLWFATACCVVFMLIGIPGNLITIIALARCKKVRNATALFIINLSFSDLLFGCFILPLAASTFLTHSWPHGKVLCIMFPLARYALVAVSIFTVLGITINRYIMVSFPRLYPKLYKKRYLIIMIASTWLLAFGALVPTLLEVWGRFSLDHIIGSCTIIPDENDRTPKKFLFIFAFVLPSVAIIGCYARILWIVRKASKKSRKPMARRPISDMENSVIDSNVGTQSVLNMSRKASQKTVSNKNRQTQFINNCFLNPGAELSSSCGDSSPENGRKTICAPETKVRSLGNENISNFRKSFIATIRRSTAPIRRLPTKKDKKLLTMIVAIMVSFCVCHLPITLTKTIFQEFTSHPIANIIGNILIYLTTCVNPIIYVVMSNEYRKAYKSLFRRAR